MWHILPGMPHRKERLRARAEDCRKLAAISSDPAAAVALESVATELEMMAAALEREETGFLTAPTPLRLVGGTEL